MLVRTNVKAGGMTVNRCETAARTPASPPQPAALRLRTGVKAGGLAWGVNRAEAARRAAAR